MGRGSGIMLRLCWKLAAGDYCELKSRAGGKKVGQKVGQKFVKRTIIVIENHRFDHQSNVMLNGKKNIEKVGILIENPGRAEPKVGKKLDKKY